MNHATQVPGLILLVIDPPPLVGGEPASGGSCKPGPDFLREPMQVGAVPNCGCGGVGHERRAGFYRRAANCQIALIHVAVLMSQACKATEDGSAVPPPRYRVRRPSGCRRIRTAAVRTGAPVPSSVTEPLWYWTDSRAGAEEETAAESKRLEVRVRRAAKFRTRHLPSAPLRFWKLQ